jgi:hypothetical protein
MQLVCDVVTKRGDKIGDRSIRSITPRAADKIYSIVINGPRGQRLRQGEKVISVCRHAWRVVHRLYPELFDKAVANPWQGVTKTCRCAQAVMAPNAIRSLPAHTSIVLLICRIRLIPRTVIAKSVSSLSKPSRCPHPMASKIS